MTSTDLLQVEGHSGDQVSLTVRTSQGESELIGSHILAATGRIPNTKGGGLELAGVK